MLMTLEGPSRPCTADHQGSFKAPSKLSKQLSCIHQRPSQRVDHSAPRSLSGLVSVPQPVDALTPELWHNIAFSNSTQLLAGNDAGPGDSTSQNNCVKQTDIIF